jgi:type IV pilus assembly protein PilQ
MKMLANVLRSMGTQVAATALAFGWLTLSGYAQAASSLEDITFSTLPGDQIEIILHFSAEPPEPGSFTVDDPARIALDLPGTTLNVKNKTINVGVGPARNINAVDAGGRARVVINLTKLVSYDTQRKGNNLVVTLGAAAGSSSSASASTNPTKLGTAPRVVTTNKIQGVDFRRGEKGEGRVVITVGDPNTAIDMSRRGDQVIVTIKNVSLPDELERRLDVLDFATPVRTVDAFTHGNDVRVVLAATGQFDHLAYQADNHITVDVKRYEKPKEEEAKKRKKQDYTGERLSLNFQNIEVRAVLQLIADFTGINMVTSDSVKGNVTLRLKNVPWDQALDIILKSKGLDKRQKGNVILVAPGAEIAAQEKLELEAQKQVKELAPLVSESIQVNYAKASDLASLLKSKGNSLVSERGNVTVDQRTNKLLVQDTAQNVAQIAALVEELDVPVRQVLIESRIVLVGTNFSKDFGVAFGVGKSSTSGGNNVVTLGSGSAAHDVANTTTTVPSFGETLNVNLPVTGAAGRIGLAIARIPFGTLLDLELSASEAEGRTEIVSSPKVITSDQHKAKILQGQEIPYLSASSSGAATISFKEAVLSLEVTPQITPDDRINMDLKVTKDSPDYGRAIFTGSSGLSAPPINKQEVNTLVLVDNGETIVLGGVFEQTKTNNVTRVPFLGDLPLIGFLFRNKSEQDDKSELLIFVTPKIIRENTKI